MRNIFIAILDINQVEESSRVLALQRRRSSMMIRLLFDTGWQAASQANAVSFPRHSLNRAVVIERFLSSMSSTIWHNARMENGTMPDSTTMFWQLSWPEFGFVLHTTRGSENSSVSTQKLQWKMILINL